MKKRILLLVLVFMMSVQLWATAVDTATVFVDIGKKDWYYKNGAIDYVYNNNLFKGTEKTKFSPNQNMTRAMFVTVLGRLNGVAVNHKEDTAFEDVGSGKYYTGYVRWAADNGIVNGVSTTEFCPDQNITREQICVMLTRYCSYECIELTEVKKAVVFKDQSSISKYAKASVALCQKSGLISGEKVSGGYRFRPVGNATRAEVATILMNFAKRYGNVHQWSLDKTVQQSACVTIARYTCTHCDQIKTIRTANHNYVFNSGIKPTCTEAGVSTGVKCGRCNEVFAKSTVLPKTGHAWVAATCTTPKYCRSCYIITQAPLGHSVRNNKCTRCGAGGTIYDDPPYGTVVTSPPTGNYSCEGWCGVRVTYTWKVDEYGGYWAPSSTTSLSPSKVLEWDKYAGPYTDYPERDGTPGEKVVKTAWVWLP